MNFLKGVLGILYGVFLTFGSLFFTLTAFMALKTSSGLELAQDRRVLYFLVACIVAVTLAAIVTAGTVFSRSFARFRQTYDHLTYKRKVRRLLDEHKNHY